MAGPGKRGRKPHEATPQNQQLVATLTGFGITQDEIALELGIDPTCLRKYYRHELDTGHLRAKAKVAGALYKNCMDGNVAAQIFWLKTQAQWRETAPDQILTVNVRNLTDADLVEIIEGRSTRVIAAPDDPGVVN